MEMLPPGARPAAGTNPCGTMRTSATESKDSQIVGCPQGGHRREPRTGQYAGPSSSGDGVIGADASHRIAVGVGTGTEARNLAWHAPTGRSDQHARREHHQPCNRAVVQRQAAESVGPKHDGTVLISENRRDSGAEIRNCGYIGYAFGSQSEVEALRTPPRHEHAVAARHPAWAARTL
jgi:hypothetical protein